MPEPLHMAFLELSLSSLLSNFPAVFLSKTGYGGCMSLPVQILLWVEAYSESVVAKVKVPTSGRQNSGALFSFKTSSCRSSKIGPLSTHVSVCPKGQLLVAHGPSGVWSISLNIAILGLIFSQSLQLFIFSSKCYQNWRMSVSASAHSKLSFSSSFS
jgi:hypothetical protein